MTRIVLLGGTGFVGRSVCDKLVEHGGGAGQTLLVPSRNPARAKHLQLLPTVELISADVHDATQLRALLEGADVVINLIAILHGSDAGFTRAHVDLPRKLVTACAAANVRRVIHVSALGVGSAVDGSRATGQEPSRYLRSKAAGEAVLHRAGLDLTVLRPSVIYGEHDKFLNLFASLLKVFPLMPLGGADARFQPVWVQDVAAAIVECVFDATTIGKTFECTGPDVYTLRQIVQAVGNWSGHPRCVVGLPSGVARAQALLMESLPGAPLLSRDNLDSMRTPNVASGTLPNLADLRITAAAMASIAPLYLAPGQGVARLDRWRADRR